MDMWNLADIFTNVCFVGWIFLRMVAWVIVKREESVGINPYYPRHSIYIRTVRLLTLKDAGGGAKVPTGQEIVCHFSQTHAMVTKILTLV